MGGLAASAKPGLWSIQIQLLFSRFLFARREIEGDLPHVIHDKVRGERTAGFRDELGQQVGAVFFEELGGLSAVDGLLQDYFVDLELAGPLVGLRLFAKIG